MLCTDAPVIAAMSSSLRSRRSPKPGALVTTHWKIPFTWFCTSMLSAAPSTFSAMMTSGRGARMTLSSTGISCCTLVIFSLRHQDVRVVEDGLEAGRVGHHVGRDVAVVVFEALDELHAHPVRPGLLDRDDAAVADRVEGLGEHRADHVVVVRRDRGHPGIVLLGHHGMGHAAQVLDQPPDGEVDAPLDQDRVAARTDRLHALANDRVGDDGGGGGAVADDVVGLDRRFLDQLRAHVLELVGQVDLSGDGHAVVGHDRAIR